MSVFHEWDNAIGAAGFRHALLVYARTRGDIGPAGKLPGDDLKHLAALPSVAESWSSASRRLLKVAAASMCTLSRDIIGHTIPAASKDRFTP